MALDIAELLASLAVIAGPDKAVAGAAVVIGRDGVAAAVPLLQPLALSAGTRRAIADHDGLLAQTRTAAATASGREDQELARIQRVRPRTLLAIAAAAGAFYFLLPQLAQVGSGWRAVQSADWAWLPLTIVMSAATGEQAYCTPTTCASGRLRGANRHWMVAAIGSLAAAGSFIVR